MAPSYDILSRRNDGDDDTRQRYLTTYKQLAIAFGTITAVLCLITLWLCFRRHRAAEFYQQQREARDNERAIHLRRVNSLNRQLQHCTCTPALPWETRRSRGNGANPAQQGPLNDSPHVIHIPGDDGTHLTFMRDSREYRPPRQEEATFVVGDDDESDAFGIEEQVSPNQQGLSHPPSRRQDVSDNRPSTPGRTPSPHSSVSANASETYGGRPAPVGSFADGRKIV